MELFGGRAALLGLKVFEKIVLVFLASVAIFTAVTLAVGFGVFQSAYEGVYLSRFKFLATETKSSIEYLLSLGLPLQPSATLTQVIDTVRAESGGVDSVAILGAGGEIIYSTDTGEIGERLPGLLEGALLADRRATSQAWTTGEDAVAVLLENHFGQTLGAVLIRYEMLDLVSVMEHAVFFLGKLGLGIFAAASALVFFGVFAAMRRPGKAVKELIAELEPLTRADAADRAEVRAAQDGALEQGTAVAYARYLAAIRATFGKLKSYEGRLTELDESV